MRDFRSTKSEQSLNLFRRKFGEHQTRYKIALIQADTTQFHSQCTALSIGWLGCDGFPQEW